MRWFRTENGLVARQLGQEDIELTPKDEDETTIVLSNNGAQNMNGTVVFVRQGKVVTYSSTGVITHSATAFPVTDVGVIPEEFRPTDDAQINTYANNSTAVYHCRINTNGSISLNYFDDAGAVSQTNSATAISGSYVRT